MSKVLVISGHPNLKESYTNQVIIDSLTNAFSQIEVRKLDELYPDFAIDAEAEQAALASADVIVLQFPFYWYSVPALLKKWIDDVFTFNFAYGPHGDKLNGKEFILSFTVGGPEESYHPLGYNHFTIEQLVLPLQQTAYLAGMNFHKPVYTHGMVYIPDVYNELAQVQQKARDHADRLISQITALTQVDERYVERFVRNWFKMFDKLPEETDFFTQYLAADVVWSMPEGEFVGHSGFRDWYQQAKAQFKPGCDHQIQAISVTKTETGYSVEFTVKLAAETFEASQFNGENIAIAAAEKWQLRVTESGQIVIDNYQVSVI